MKQSSLLENDVLKIRDSNSDEGGWNVVCVHEHVTLRMGRMIQWLEGLAAYLWRPEFVAPDLMKKPNSSIDICDPSAPKMR